MPRSPSNIKSSRPPRLLSSRLHEPNFVTVCFTVGFQHPSLSWSLGHDALICLESPAPRITRQTPPRWREQQGRTSLWTQGHYLGTCRPWGLAQLTAESLYALRASFFQQHILSTCSSPEIAALGMAPTFRRLPVGDTLQSAHDRPPRLNSAEASEADIHCQPQCIPPSTEYPFSS